MVEVGLNAAKTGDARKFVSSLAENAMIIDENKMWTRSEIASFIKDFKLTSYQISQPKFIRTSSRSCVYAYRILEIGTFQKTPFKLDLYITTSWGKRNGTWKTYAIQETNVKSAKAE